LSLQERAANRAVVAAQRFGLYDFESLFQDAAEPRDGGLQGLGADSDAMGHRDRDIGEHDWEPTKIPRGINPRALNLRVEYRCELFDLRQQVPKLGCSFGGWFLGQGGLRL
jgi:hypothetical protein